jgi:hypothetical protein
MTPDKAPVSSRQRTAQLAQVTPAGDLLQRASRGELPR